MKRGKVRLLQLTGSPKTLILPPSNLWFANSVVNSSFEKKPKSRNFNGNLLDLGRDFYLSPAAGRQFCVNVNTEGEKGGIAHGLARIFTD